MKRGTVLITFSLFILMSLCSFSSAGEEKRLNLTIKDGKVSADIHNASLKEVAHEISKRWGVSVELYGGIDLERLASTKFEDLPLLDSLYRLFRGANFAYIRGEKLYLLGFGESSTKSGGIKIGVSPSSVQGVSKEQGARLSPEIKREGSGRLTQLSRPSGGQESRRRGWPMRGGEPKLNVEEDEEDKEEDLEETDESDESGDSKRTGTSFTTPILLEVKGQTISALSCDITYDPGLLTKPKAVIGDSARKAGKDVIFNEVRPGLLRVGIVGMNQKLIPDGLVAHVTFDVVKEGKISLTHRPTASDPGGKSVPVVFKDGKIVKGR
jgi:hypothetical protein